jgi:hypothetical protein
MPMLLRRMCAGWDRLRTEVGVDRACDGLQPVGLSYNLTAHAHAHAHAYTRTRVRTHGPLTHAATLVAYRRAVAALLIDVEADGAPAMRRCAAGWAPGRQRAAGSRQHEVNEVYGGCGLVWPLRQLDPPPVLGDKSFDVGSECICVQRAAASQPGNSKMLDLLQHLITQQYPVASSQTLLRCW